MNSNTGKLWLVMSHAWAPLSFYHKNISAQTYNVCLFRGLDFHTVGLSHTKLGVQLEIIILDLVNSLILESSYLRVLLRGFVNPDRTWIPGLSNPDLNSGPLYLYRHPYWIYNQKFQLLISTSIIKLILNMSDNFFFLNLTMNIYSAK